MLLAFGGAAQVEASGLEDDLDDLFLSQPSDAQAGAQPGETQSTSGATSWRIKGDVEDRYYRSVLNTDGGYSRHETRLRLDTEYTFKSYTFFSSLDGYLIYQEEYNENSKNKEYTGEKLSFDPSELYLETTTGNTRVRVGKQLLGWGVGDLFQVTNYYDQLDFRQMLAIDTDDRLRGTPLVLIERYFDDLALDVVLTPAYAPVLMSEYDSFWAMDLGEQEGLTYEFSDHYDAGNGLFRDANYKNEASVALRFGGVLGNVDAHISYYNGISKVLLAEPSLRGVLSYADDRLVSVDPRLSFKFYEDRADTAGFDFASSSGRFTYRLELAYTPNQAALKQFDQQDIGERLTGEINARLPLQGTGAVEFDGELVARHTQPYLAWVTGGDYNYRGVNGFFLIEWVKGKYLRRSGDYIKPLFDDLLLLRWEDKFFNERLHAEVIGLLGPVRKRHGSDINLNLSWDFKNGFVASSSIYLFNGRGNNLLFDQLDQKDVAKFSLSYEF